LTPSGVNCFVPFHHKENIMSKSMVAYNSVNDQSPFIFKIFFAGEMVEWFISTDPKIAMKGAIKMMAKRKDQRKGRYVLFRPATARPGDVAAVMAYSRGDDTSTHTKEGKLLEECDRKELRRAAKQGGLVEFGVKFMHYCHGLENQNLAFDKKVVKTLKELGYSRLVQETPSRLVLK
jgi:hypothetical protein